MDLAFQTILIPIDFSINSSVATGKALEIINGQPATIHLLHVAGLTNWLHQRFIVHQNADERNRMTEWKQKSLDQLKESILTSNPNIRVTTSIVQGSSIIKALEDKAEKVGADLIIISKNLSHSWFPALKEVKSGKIARRTGTTVLTVRPGSLNHKIKTVIVPVNGVMKEQKMKAMTALHSRFRFRVHLVTFFHKNKSKDDPSWSLMESFHWIRDHLHCPIEYTVLHGTNKAKALLHYAELLEADLMLLDPEEETMISWQNKGITDVLPAESRLQVLMLPAEFNN